MEKIKNYARLGSLSLKIMLVSFRWLEVQQCYLNQMDVLNIYFTACEDRNFGGGGVKQNLLRLALGRQQTRVSKTISLGLYIFSSYFISRLSSWVIVFRGSK